MGKNNKGLALAFLAFTNALAKEHGLPPVIDISKTTFSTDDLPNDKNRTEHPVSNPHAPK